MDENSNRNGKFSNRNNSTKKTKTKLPKIREIQESTKEINIKNSFRKMKSEEEEEEEERIKNKLLRNASPCDICIEALKNKPSERNEESIKTISFYLQMIKNFMNTFKGQVENEELEELLFNISSKLKYEHIEKNKLICRFGDKSNKFYLILKGKVTFYVPKLNKQYFSQEEYIKFLLNLRMKDEIELIKINMEKNNFKYNLGDDFDNYILNTLKKHEKKKQNIFSMELYNKFKEVKELIEKEKRKHRKENEQQTYEDIEDYLERCQIDISNNPHEAEKNNRNNLDIYRYEKTNVFEDGEYFGFVANRKNTKRSATAITLDDCELAVLYLNEYNEILGKINRKAKEKLYNLVSYNKLFTQISKPIFINKYSHMFKFERFYINNIIMDDTQYLNKIIIFNSGEFILFVNKNIIELNELIIKLKRIKGMMLNIPEEKIKEESSVEIKENENYILNKKFIPKIFYQKIIARQNLIISTIKKNMVIGYPDTIDPKTFMPLFNCRCVSTNATGYSVEREMINLFNRDNYLRTTPTKVSLAKIDFYLMRLLDYKTNIMNNITNLENSEDKHNKKLIKIKRDDIDYDIKNENTNTIKLINKSLDLNDDKKEDTDNEKKENNLNIYMKEINSRNAFQNLIIPKEIDKSFTKGKNTANSLPSLNSTQNNNNNNTINNEFFTKISKLRQNINKKKNLLRIIQKKSHKFMTQESIENKKYLVRFSNDKSYYNDLSNIFSKDPNQKQSILDKYLKKSEDNILDPTINDINRKINYEKKLSSFLLTSNNIVNNNDITQLKKKQTNDNGFNFYTKNDLIRNMKLIFGNKRNNNNAFSLKKRNLKYDSPKKFKEDSISRPNDSELKNVKINYNNLSLDLDKIRNNDLNFNNETNNNILYNELYTEYITNELYKSNNSNKLLNTINYKLKPEKKIKSLSTYHKLNTYKLKNTK